LAVLRRQWAGKVEEKMINRISVSALLKLAFGVMAAVIVFVLASGAWDASNRLRMANKIAANAEASAYLFTTLSTLRTARAFTLNALQGEAASDLGPIVATTRAAGIDALKNGLVAMQSASLPAGSTGLADLQAGYDRIIAFYKEADAAITLPKTQRRATLADEGFKSTTVLMSHIEEVSSQLAMMVKFDDSYIGQLFQLKAMAWLVRNGAGDTALLVNNSYTQRPAPEAMGSYAEAFGRVVAGMSLIDETIKQLPLPAYVTGAIESFRKEYFGDFDRQQRRILAAHMAGEKVEVDKASWDKVTVPKVNIPTKIADGALQAAKERAAEMYAAAQYSLYMQLILLAAAAIVGLAMMAVITRRITNPLITVQKVMIEIAGGNFSASLAKTERTDEIGQIITSVNTMVDQVRSAIGEIKASGREVTNASAEISTSTTDLSQRTEEQAASLEETSAAMEELSATVKKNAENAQQASQSATATRDVADRGGQVVAKAVEAMAKIEDSSRKISDIIGVIDEIARQTNLLALNAAVEAARAGEAGRGFAVVASEVRSLAQRSSQAAKDITNLIVKSNDQVKDGVDLVNRAGASLTEIVDAIKGVATIVADIAHASGEQATGIEQINKALTQMDEVTQQNSALVEENAATAKTLEHQAQAMDGQMAFFQIDGAASTHGEPKRAASRAAAPLRAVAPRSRAA
jgi:methyl-accepting chemotaxis protein